MFVLNSNPLIYAHHMTPNFICDLVGENFLKSVNDPAIGISPYSIDAQHFFEIVNFDDHVQPWHNELIFYDQPSPKD